MELQPLRAFQDESIPLSLPFHALSIASEAFCSQFHMSVTMKKEKEKH